MKLTRENFLNFILIDTVFWAAMWYFVLPKYLQEALIDPLIKNFYYYALPLLWIIANVYIFFSFKPKKRN
ncbi:MAG TPA: hypothetical protein P5080_04665 [Candidatus Paceibacterota bacterium]|nr:hypothetical protein [Candidatus Pacearchaeota archaeon]HRZ51243.1 hypothetical protein [Candidatus Paceibacterota bacterium]HSA36965.1 hypothetical protein [Candidatus Paceibacterota bacterium]